MQDLEQRLQEKESSITTQRVNLEKKVSSELLRTAGLQQELLIEREKINRQKEVVVRQCREREDEIKRLTNKMCDKEKRLATLYRNLSS